MKVDTVMVLVNLGLALASDLVAKKSGKPIEEMTDEEILSEISNLQIDSPDALIEEGRKRAGA